MILFDSSSKPTSISEAFIHVMKALYGSDLLLCAPYEIKGINHKPFPESTDYTVSLFSSNRRLQKQLVQNLQIEFPNRPFLCLDWKLSLLLLSIADRTINHMVFTIPSDLPTSLIKKYRKAGSNIKLLVVSEVIQNYLRGESIDSRYIDIVPLPYMTSVLPKKEQHQSFIAAMVSPLLPGHGIETVIQALNEIQEFIPQLNVVIIGNGPEKRRLMWLIEHLHLNKKVQLVANDEQYERFFPNVDVYIDASPYEKTWNPAIVHALGQGIPVLATNIGVHPELIEHNERGLLFEPNNVTMLSQHLINLYNNPSWIQHYRKNGINFVENRLSLQKMKAKLKEIL